MNNTLFVTIIFVIMISFVCLVTFNVNAESNQFFDNGWGMMNNITIDSNMIDEDLVNFPILVNINNTTILSYMQDDGDDLRFTDSSNNTVFNYEIESINNTELFVWVNITNISSSVDTVFRMYYNNSVATSGENITGTWDSNFVMVQHMNDATTSSILDSTSYNNDGSKKGANEPIVDSSGMIADAQDFDGTDDFINISDNINTIEGYDAGTISSFFKIDSTQVGTIFSLMDGTGAGNRIYLVINSVGVYADESLSFYIQRGGTDRLAMYLRNSINLYADNQWHHITVKTGDGDNSIFIDGIEETVTFQTGFISSNEFSNIDNSDVAYLGVRKDMGSLSRYLTDYIDEVRISNIARSSAWINTSFDSSNQTTGFLSMGDVFEYVNASYSLEDAQEDLEYIKSNMLKGDDEVELGLETGMLFLIMWLLSCVGLMTIKNKFIVGFCF